MTAESPRYSLGEEIAHSVTHGLGVVLSIAGLAVMVTLAALRGNAWHVVSCSIFGVTLIFLYTASTLYHSIPHPGAKKVLRLFDHSAIFLLIAGTYTPFTLVTLRGGWGWTLFVLIWGLALVGIIYKITAKNPLSTALGGALSRHGLAGPRRHQTDGDLGGHARAAVYCWLAASATPSA